MCVLLPSGETQNYISAQKERSRLRDHSEACFCRYFWYLRNLALCFSKSLTVSWISSGVMCRSNIGMDSRLGGDVGQSLVLGNARLVFRDASGVTNPSNEENLVSSVCNLLDTISPMLKRLSFLSLNILTMGLTPFMLERTL